MSDNAQLFANGARWDIAVAIAVAAILAGAVFGWRGVAAVLAVPVGIVLVVGAAATIVVISVVAAVKSIEKELEEIEDE